MGTFFSGLFPETKLARRPRILGEVRARDGSSLRRFDQRKGASPAKEQKTNGGFLFFVRFRSSGARKNQKTGFGFRFFLGADDEEAWPSGPDSSSRRPDQPENGRALTPKRRNSTGNQLHLA